MSAFSDGIRAAINFDISAEQNRVHEEIDKIRQDAIANNHFQSSRYSIVIMQACIDSFRRSGAITWNAISSELRRDVFFVLRNDEDEILKDVVALIDQLFAFYETEFNRVAGKNAEKFGRAGEDIFKSLRHVQHQMLAEYKIQIDKIFSLARGDA